MSIYEHIYIYVYIYVYIYIDIHIYIDICISLLLLPITLVFLILLFILLFILGFVVLLLFLIILILILVLLHEQNDRYCDCFMHGEPARHIPSGIELHLLLLLLLLFLICFQLLCKVPIYQSKLLDSKPEQDALHKQSPAASSSLKSAHAYNKLDLKHACVMHIEISFLTITTCDSHATTFNIEISFSSILKKYRFCLRARCFSIRKIARFAITTCIVVSYRSYLGSSCIEAIDQA